MSKKKDIVAVVCSSGEALHTKPISIKLLEQFDLSHKEPDPPMVEAEAAGGTKELIPNPDDPAYQKMLDAYRRRTGDEFMSLILDLGLEFEMPNDNRWEKSLRRAGICVPDDPDDKRLLYLQSFVMTNFMTDFQAIAASVLRQSGVSEEAIDSWTALF